MTPYTTSAILPANRKPMSDEQKTTETVVEPTPEPNVEPVVEASAEVATPATDVAPAEVIEATETAAAVGELAREDVKPGMVIRVHERIKDVSPKGEERERVQVFQGMVLSVRGAGASKTFVVRRASKGWGVEKIYPLQSPNIAKLELVKQFKVRRAKLFFLSNLRNPFKRKMKEAR